MSPTLCASAPRQDGFASTRWSIVLAAGETEDSAGHAYGALSELCRIYWRPLYLFLRHKGYSRFDAQDLTQGFFANLITTRSFARAVRDKGRFRSFLLGALKHYLADAHDRDRTQKRGGGKSFEPWDEEAIAEAEARVAPAEVWSVEQHFDREWAVALLREAFNRLAEECTLAGKRDLFEALKIYISATDQITIPYEEMSQRLRRPAVTLRGAVMRLRARYRAILREETGATVTEPAEIDEELRYLCRVLATT